MKKLILLLLLLWVAPLQAVTRYVDGSMGSDCTSGNYSIANRNCTGSNGNAWNTIVEGINNTAAGDTLYIRAGTYAVGIHSDNQTIPTGTSFANAPVISAYSGETVNLPYFGFGAPSNFSPAQTEIKYVIVIGFRFNGAGHSGDAGGFWGNVHHIRVQNCEFFGAPAGEHMGFSMFENGLGGVPQFNEILGGSSHNNGLANEQAHGFYIGGDNNLIDGVEMYGNGDRGIQIYNANRTPTGNTIRNCKIHNNGLGTSTGSGITLYGNANYAYNNIIYSNKCGMDGSGGSNNRFLNNTIYGNTDNGITRIGSSPIIRNNIVVNNGSGIDSGGTQSHNLTSCSGCFENTSTGDFHLVSTATAAIDNGTALTDFSTTSHPVSPVDFEATSRPQGLAWDIGADEYAAGATPVITVITPNGGNSWLVGSTQTITWGSVSAGSTVTITLDRGNDGTFEQTITASTANNGSFSWVVDGAANANCKIKVKDTAAATNDVSDNVFAITSSSGGGFTGIISDNTTGPKVGSVTGTSDAWIWELSPTINEGTDAAINVNKYELGGHRHQLLKFDGLAQVPTNATVTSATLGIYVASGGNAAAQTWDVRRLLRNWNESQATWNVFSTGNSWTTAGGLGAGTDRVSATSAQITGVTITPGFFTVTSTDTSAGTLLDDVRKIVNGTYSNFGWHLERNGTGNDSAYRDGVSSEGADGQRPYLELVYTTTTSTITVTQPTSGDLFLVGDAGPIRWTSSGISGNVRVDISRDNGATWDLFIASVPFNSADASGTYTAPVSSSCKVRVVSLNDTSILGTSTGTFRIGGTRAGFKLTP